MFENCDYKTNVYDNFKSHKYRQHSGTGNTFKSGISSVEKFSVSVASDISDEEITESNENLNCEDSENLEKTIEIKIASVLLNWSTSYLCLMQL